MIHLKTPSGSPITCYQEWTRPKKSYQWKAGRSAMELARSWFRTDHPSPPDELLSLFRSSTRLNNLQIISGIPEQVTPLPERGEGRNHDLALIGNTDNEQVTVTIEAKADEPFGNDTILEYYTTAIRRRNSGTPTRVPERIEQLLDMVAPNVPVKESKWKDIRYQLLTALCGTILQAKIDGSDLAVLIIHEFQSTETVNEKQAKNQNDLERFIGLLSGKDIDLVSGRLYDGYTVAGRDLMVGKVVARIS